VAIAAIGCSPVSGTPSPSTTTSSRLSAPKVAHPLDTTKYQAAACSLLTAAQVAQYGITDAGNAGDGTSALGPGCSWSQLGGSGFTVEFITANKAGLTSLYINKDIIVNGGGYWVATTVQGYPGVFNSSLDDRKTGDCSLAVGVTDTLTFNVALTADKSTPQYSDPCGMGSQIADMVLTTMRGGA
jgi:hypothetical protein